MFGDDAAEQVCMHDNETSADTAAQSSECSGTVRGVQSLEEAGEGFMSGDDAWIQALRQVLPYHTAVGRILSIEPQAPCACVTDRKGETG